MLMRQRQVHEDLFGIWRLGRDDFAGFQISAACDRGIEMFKKTFCNMI